MDLKLIQKIVRMMSRADLTELEIDDTDSGLKLRLKRGTEGVAGPAPVVQVLGGGAPVPQMGFAPVPVGAIGPEAEAGDPDALPEGAQQIPSPMVGTFYRAASPDASPFVDVGGRIRTDDVICIIEAMKVMNELKAEVGGEILGILVENGEPVEFGQPLFLVKTS